MILKAETDGNDEVTDFEYRQMFRNVYSEDFLFSLLLPAARRKSPTDFLKLTMDAMQVVTRCGRLDDVIIHVRENWQTPFAFFERSQNFWPIYSIKGFEHKQLSEYKRGKLDEAAKTLAPPSSQAAVRIVKGAEFGDDQKVLIQFLKRFGISAGGISHSWMPQTHPETLITLFYNFEKLSYSRRPSDREISMVEELTIPFALAILLRHGFVSEGYLKQCFDYLAGLKPLRLRVVREMINSEHFEPKYLAEKIGVSVPTIRYHIKASSEHILRLSGKAELPRKHQMLLINRTYSFLAPFGLWRKARD